MLNIDAAVEAERIFNRSLSGWHGADSSTGVILGGTIPRASRSIWYSLDDQLWEARRVAFSREVKT